MLYFTMIHPYLVYCNVIWGSASHLALSQLIRLQKRALRIITGSSYLAHTAPLFAQKRILNIYDLYKLQVLIFMYKEKHNMLPECCSSYIKITSKTHRYDYEVILILNLIYVGL